MKNIQSLKNEESRILVSPEANEKPRGLGTLRYIAYCNNDAPLVLERSKEVLLKVNRALQFGDPEETEWSSILPAYFVYRCVPDCPHTLSKRRVELRRKLYNIMTPEENGLFIDMLSWNLLSWIHWFQNEERYWYWWDSCLHDNNRILVTVEIHEWPCPTDELSWLFRGCGAYSFEEEPEDVNPNL